MRTSWGIVGMRGAWRHVLGTKLRVAGAKVRNPFVRNAVRAAFLARRGNLSAIWTANYRAGFKNQTNTGEFKSWTGHDLSVDWADPLGLEGARVSAGVFNLTDDAAHHGHLRPLRHGRAHVAAGWGRTYLPHPQHALLRRKGAPPPLENSGSRPGPMSSWSASHIVVLGRPLFVIPGLVPAIHFRLRDGPEGDTRNKSGHDGKRGGATPSVLSRNIRTPILKRTLRRAPPENSFPACGRSRFHPHI